MASILRRRNAVTGRERSLRLPGPRRDLPGRAEASESLQVNKRRLIRTHDPRQPGLRRAGAPSTVCRRSRSRFQLPRQAPAAENVARPLLKGAGMVLRLDHSTHTSCATAELTNQVRSLQLRPLRIHLPARSAGGLKLREPKMISAGPGPLGRREGFFPSLWLNNK